MQFGAVSSVVVRLCIGFAGFADEHEFRAESECRVAAVEHRGTRITVRYLRAEPLIANGNQLPL